MRTKLLTCSSRQVAGGSFAENDATCRGRHYGTNAHDVSSAAYSGVELTYSARPAAFGPAGFVGLPKTERGLDAVTFGFESPGKIVGNPGSQVRVLDGHRDLERALEVPVRRLPPAARMGSSPGHPVHGHRRQRIGGPGGEVDRLLDEVARALHLLGVESGLSHTGNQVRQDLTIADPPEVIRPLGEEPLCLRHTALLEQHVAHIEPKLSGHPDVAEGLEDAQALLRIGERPSVLAGLLKGEGEPFVDAGEWRHV